MGDGSDSQICHLLNNAYMTVGWRIFDQLCSFFLKLALAIQGLLLFNINLGLSVLVA